jgi:hypothetical protein
MILVNDILKQASFQLEEKLTSTTNIDNYYGWIAASGIVSNMNEVYFWALNQSLAKIQSELKNYLIRWKTLNFQPDQRSLALPLDFIRPYYLWWNGAVLWPDKFLFNFPYREFLNFHGDKIIIASGVSSPIELIYFARFPRFTTEPLGPYGSSQAFVMRGSDTIRINAVLPSNYLNALANGNIYLEFFDYRFVYSTQFAYTSSPNTYIKLNSNFGDFRENDTTEIPLSYQINTYIPLNPIYENAIVQLFCYYLKQSSGDKEETERFLNAGMYEIKKLAGLVSAGQTPLPDQVQIIY